MTIEAELVSNRELRSSSHTKAEKSDHWSERFSELISSEEPSTDALAEQIANQFVTEASRLDSPAEIVQQCAHLVTPERIGSTLLQHFRSARDTSKAETTLSMQEATFVLIQYAPQAMLAGTLLQKTFDAARSGTELAAILHRMHQTILRQHHHSLNTHECYAATLRHLNVQVPPLGSTRLRQELGIQELSFEVPTIDLAMSRFPDRFAPEILGACLYDAVHGVPSLVHSAAEKLREAGNNIAGDLFLSEFERQCVLDDAIRAINHFVCHSIRKSTNFTALISRICASATLRGQRCSDWADQIGLLAARGFLLPGEKMLRMLRKKAKYAVGYHEHLRLGGCPFDQLLKDNPSQFIDELATSRYIVPGEPDRSVLLTSLIAPKGKMFRIFQPDELDIIRSWVTSLSVERSGAIGHTLALSDLEVEQTNLDSKSVTADSSRIKKRTTRRSRRQTLSIRDMYFRLLNVESDYEIKRPALDYALDWLRLAERQNATGARPAPFLEYSHHALKDWFDDMVSKQIASYRPKDPKDYKSRDRVVDEAMQLCPLVMIDGAWLQGWCSPSLVDSPIGRILYTIYSDEIGNGDISLNHPNIYRSLMDEMGIDLPEIGSRSFADWDGFRDESFRVPVLWLSLSQFPRRFIPETLGLNLAMELSGVGGAYRSARDELRHYGFSSHFVDLHNTIDNVSSGHSAMAMEAIQLYMDDVIESHDRHAPNLHWRRIWTGYLALVCPSESFLSRFYRSANYDNAAY